MRDGLLISNGLMSGLYGPIMELNNNYRLLDMMRASAGSKDPLPPFWKVYPEEYKALTGEEYVSPKRDLGRQALLFAEATGSITKEHAELLEEMRDGNNET